VLTLPSRQELVVLGKSGSSSTLTRSGTQQASGTGIAAAAGGGGGGGGVVSSPPDRMRASSATAGTPV
jgi:hypothetical protein